MPRCSPARPTISTCTSFTTCLTTLQRRVRTKSTRWLPFLNRLSAQVEEHIVDGRVRTLLVHRKVCCAARLFVLRASYLHSDFCLMLQGSTRAFPPHHPLIPVDYQFTGQPVMIGGTMARPAIAPRGAAAHSARACRARAATCSQEPKKACKRHLGGANSTRAAYPPALTGHWRMQHMPRRWQSAQPKQLSE